MEALTRLMPFEINPNHFWIFTIGSIFMTIAGLAATVLFLILLPKDYFYIQSIERTRFPLTPSRVLKNLIGICLLFMGISMLVLPGQGLLTIMMSLLLIDTPITRRLGLRIVRRPKVLESLNQLRQRFGYSPLTPPLNMKIRN